MPVVIEKKRPAKEMLESSHCYVLDSFSEMYVWIGRGCTTGSKNAISGIAKELFFARARIARLGLAFHASQKVYSLSSPSLSSVLRNSTRGIQAQATNTGHSGTKHYFFFKK